MGGGVATNRKPAKVLLHMEKDGIIAIGKLAVYFGPMFSEVERTRAIAKLRRRLKAAGIDASPEEGE
jgi:hypothetical protein